MVNKYISPNPGYVINSVDYIQSEGAFLETADETEPAREWRSRLNRLSTVNDTNDLFNFDPTSLIDPSRVRGGRQRVDAFDEIPTIETVQNAREWRSRLDRFNTAIDGDLTALEKGILRRI